LLASGFDALGADPNVIARESSVSLSEVGGFLALRTPNAAQLSAALRARGVLTDYRGDVLRLGPAPYVTDRALEAAIGALAEAVA